MNKTGAPSNQHLNVKVNSDHKKMAERYAWKILSLWNVCEMRTEFYILQLKPIIEIGTCAVALHEMCEIFRNLFVFINFRFFVLFSVTPKWFLAEPNIQKHS